MLQVENLRSGYGRIPILLGIDMQVENGSTVGVLGHNGMGKSTLLRALMGYLPATGGAVHLDGRDITRLAPFDRARIGVGYVPQGREIFPRLTALENLRMGCLLSNEDERQTIERTLEEFPRLKPLLDRYGGALSGGEQQILAIARCLCGKPRLMLLDEPTEGIQPSIIEEIIDILVSLRREWGLTIILMEQNLEFIASLADRILIIQKGAIVKEVPPNAIRNRDIMDEFLGMSA